MASEFRLEASLQIRQATLQISQVTWTGNQESCKRRMSEKAPPDVPPYCAVFPKVLCFHALDKLSRKRPFTLTKCLDNMWAAGIVYAIAQNCYLIGSQFDLLCGKPKYHFTSDEIAGAFGVSKGSASAKAKAIRKQPEIRNDRTEWLPPDMRKMNTMVNDLQKALGIM